MDLRQMRYVVAVADHGTFTAAATAVHVAQPSLSQTIRSLEAELGVELFHRSGRQVRLTAAGRAFLPPARQALRDAAVVGAAVAAVAGVEAGELDVVCLPSLAVHPVAELVGAFRGAHRRVTVRVHEPDDPGELVRLVRDGACEVGVTELPTDAAGVEAHPLGTHDYVAVLPAALAGEIPAERIGLRALATRPLITTPVGTSTRRQVDEAFAAVGVTPSVAVETEHREAITPLVVAGAGVSLLPRPLAEDAVTRGALLRAVTPRVVREIGLVVRTGPLSPAAAAFLALAQPDSEVRRARPRPRRRRRPSG